MPSPCSSNPVLLRSSLVALTVALAASMAPAMVFGQAAPRPATSNNADADRQALLDRIEALEKRLSDLEQTAVLSAPKVLVKEVKVWVDKDGNSYDHPVPGAKETTTYQRELAHRRQTIEDEITDKLAEESANSISIGVNNVTTLQVAHQTRGADTVA